MELIQRYLSAIEFWLPRNQKKDIIAEISEDLHSQIEERESQLGRALNDAELDALLKQRGNPLLVANQYLPQQSLIGPNLFPIYKFVLKIAALCWPLPAAIVFVLVQRTQHPEIPWLNTIGATASWLWAALFTGVGVITLAFVVLERVNTKTHFLENWNPRKLPPVRDPNKISRVSSAIEIVVNLAFFAFLISYATSPQILNGPALRVSLNPSWIYFVWVLLATSLLNTALAAANLMRPYWTTPRAIFSWLLDLAGAAVFCTLLKMKMVAVVVFSASNADPTIITTAVNMAIEQVFPYAVAISVVIAGIKLYRITRLKGRPALDQHHLTGLPSSSL